VDPAEQLAMSVPWRLRPEDPTDRPFVFHLYCSTRMQALSGIGWADAQLQAFLAMQYEAQRRHYAAHFPGASTDVIEVRGAAAGRLLWTDQASEILLIDLSLLPEHRGTGIGTAVLREQQRRAGGKGKALVLHVEEGNRACRLYQRLGFEVTAQHGPHLHMRWQPQDALLTQPALLH
jgi:ribosomal protein S18 acetylase RimI-like enzyme